MNAFPDMVLPERSVKPRQNGITMVLDKGLGLLALEDLLSSGAHSIDVVKLGWGTSVIQCEDLIRRKCVMLAECQILACPGGTLSELAWLQGRFTQYLERTLELGFSCIEISDGTVPMPLESKIALIRQVQDMGLRVVSEVGSKLSEEDARISLKDRIAQIEAELAAGAWKVIIEARESGTQGIFDGRGNAKLDVLQALLEHVGMGRLIFEAPLRAQQTDLILTLGNDVNLGNIAPNDVVSLETLRTGLRSDTLRFYHMNYPVVRIGLGASAALAASRREDVIIVVDALRASSTIVTALQHGLSGVRTVTSIEDCIGDITAGERGGRKVDHLDFDNSPISFTDAALEGRELVLTTTNGTECLAAAASNPGAITFVGALLNATAVARAAFRCAQKNNKNISIVCAGRNNKMAQEDLIAASEIALAMSGAPVLGEIKPVVCTDYYKEFLGSDSGKNLSSLGKTEDVIFCSIKDKYQVVPIYSDGVVCLEME